MKRSGFTMIELIFVIVILGILAAVAIPKLAATRDDAKVSALATSVNMSLNEIVGMVTGGGTIDNDLSTMSNALESMETIGDATVVNGVLGASSYVINAVPDNGGAKVPCITVATTGDGNLTVTHAGAASIICTGLRNLVPNSQNLALKGSKIVF